MLVRIGIRPFVQGSSFTYRRFLASQNRVAGLVPSSSIAKPACPRAARHPSR